MDIEAYKLILMVLVTFSLLFIVTLMFGFDLKYSLKIKNKTYLFPVGSLVVVLILLLFCWPSKNTPKEQLIQASMDYHLCLTQSANSGSCDEYKSTLKVKILTAEMLGLDKEAIRKAVNRGRDEVKH